MSVAKAKTAAWFILVIFTMLCVFFAWQTKNFEVDASADTLLMKDNRLYLESQLNDQRYNPEEFILIAYRPQTDAVFSEAVMRRLLDISSTLREMPRVEDVLSLASVPFFAGLDNFESGFDPDELTWESQQYSAESMRNLATNHPLYEGLLVNEDMTALSMQVVFTPDKALTELDNRILDLRKNLLERELTGEETQQIKALSEERAALSKALNQTRSEEIEQIRAILEPYAGTGDFFLGGNNLLAHQLIEIIKSDLTLFGSLIAAIVVVVLWFLFRRWYWVVLPILCCGVSVLITIGLLGWLGLKVTVISTNVVALQIILALAVIIHLVVQYQELVEAEQLSTQLDLVRETIRRKLKPCFFAVLTTTIGFGSLVFSGVAPVISFGWMMVLAMLVTLTVSLLLFPALLMICVRRQQQVHQHGWINRGMRAAAGWIGDHPRLVGVGSLALTLFFAVGCLRLSAENSFINYFSESTDVFRELSFIDQQFGGSTPFDIIYRVPTAQQQSDLVITAGAVQALTGIQQRLQAHEAVGNITSVADFTRIAATVSGQPLTEYELTAVYRTLDESIRSNLFGSYFDESAQQARISTRIQDTTPDLDRSQLLEALRADMDSLGIPPAQYQFSGLFVLYQDILGRLVESQWKTAGIVYLAMAMVLLLVFRSLKIALVALAPNLMTTLIILGAMGWLGITLDLMTMTIAAVAMGISVDGTIHYIHRYLAEQAQDPQAAIERSHLSVGYALVYTTGVIVIGFAALMFSDFMPSVYFGGLTALAMMIAMLTDLTILPVLLRRILSNRSQG